MIGNVVPACGTACSDFRRTLALVWAGLCLWDHSRDDVTQEANAKLDGFRLSNLSQGLGFVVRDLMKPFR